MCVHVCILNSSLLVDKKDIAFISTSTVCIPSTYIMCMCIIMVLVCCLYDTTMCISIVNIRCRDTPYTGRVLLGCHKENTKGLLKTNINVYTLL